jgi:hypothetical protein
MFAVPAKLPQDVRFPGRTVRSDSETFGNLKKRKARIGTMRANKMRGVRKKREIEGSKTMTVELSLRSCAAVHLVVGATGV